MPQIECPKLCILTFENFNDLSLLDRRYVLSEAHRIQDMCTNFKKDCPDDCKIKKFIEERDRKIQK